MIQYYEWLPQLETIEGVSSISNELLTFSFSDIKSYVQKINPFHNEAICKPHKFDFFLVAYHKAGSAILEIDMEKYDLSEPANIIRLLPGQIVAFNNTSPDFDVDVVIMSKSFVDNLLVFANGRVPFSFDKRLNAVVRIGGREKMASMFIKAIRHILDENAENPYKSKIVQHVMMAIFYSSENLSRTEVEKPRTNADILSKEFLALVKEHFREERQLKFYADKMCITPRYLSRVVKECTQFSAADWIERFVVLEARALLKSTNMTVQQISDELNFPSQTFFGKYFKRRGGLSPKEYRRIG